VWRANVISFSHEESKEQLSGLLSPRIKTYSREMIAQFVFSQFSEVFLILIGGLLAVWLIVSFLSESKLKTWDLRWGIGLKIVQCGAFIAAGTWVVYSAYDLYKKNAIRSASSFGCTATTTLRVDPIPGGDGQKSIYLVTVHTQVRNDTDRVVLISNYWVDFYAGKTLAEPSSSFVVQPPKLQLAHPTIEWKQFGQYIFEPKGYENSTVLQQWFGDKGVIGQRHHNQEPKKDSEPTANSNESSILDTSSYIILNAGQSCPFENHFVISASENDWIATDSVLIYHTTWPYQEGDIPETLVENIAVALRRGSEIAPKSSPPGSNPGPR
jgi:hypothetical protein